MSNFFKNLFKKKKSSNIEDEQEYLDFNDYTDVSIDLKNIHTKKSSNLTLDPKLEPKVEPKLKEEVIQTPPLPFEKADESSNFETNSRIIFVDDKPETEVNTRDFARLGELLKQESKQNVDDSFEKSQLILGKKPSDITIKKTEEQRRNVVSDSFIDSSNTMSKTYETVNFQIGGGVDKKSKKSLYLLILSLLGLVLLFVLLKSDPEDDANVSEEATNTTLAAMKKVSKTSKHRINYKSAGAGLVYNCSAKHWACVDNKNFKKCKVSSVDKVCISVKIYKSKTTCQRVQQKAIDLNKKVKSCN